MQQGSTSKTINETTNDYLNFINGRWLRSESGKWVNNTNPAQPAQVLGRSTQSTQQEVLAAIHVAASSQKAWAQLPRPRRGAYLAETAKILRSRVDAIAKILTQEEGKNLTEAKGEVLKAIHSLEFNASEGRRAVGTVIPSEMPNTFLYTTRAPLGVVGVITPWNFPICIPAWKIGPALLEGNTVVFKPATLTPATAVELVRAFEEAELPQGVLNMVLGSGAVVGDCLADDLRVKALSFTGSNPIGTRLYARAATRLARVQLEMGGKNPIIVLADADLEQAADATVMGAFGSTGQRCTATSRVIIEEKVFESFKKTLLARINSLRVGNGLEDPKAMGPVVDQSQYASVCAAIETAQKQGARLLVGGVLRPESPLNATGGYFVPPTVFDQVTQEMSIAKEEVFGPVLALMKVQDFDQAIEVANSVDFGLSSSVYTQDIQKVMQYADRIESGILHINSPTVGGEVQAPFGGMKLTGLGEREMGTTGPEFFCDTKTVYVDYNSTVRAGNSY